jgi:dihydrodipicolinate synthase/N-acetylneuraminate lyase
MVDWYNDVVNQRWEEARHRQERMHAFNRAKAVLEETGNLHGVVGKAMTVASPFLVGANHTRQPYLAVSEERIAQFRRIVEEDFTDMTWKG